MTGDQFKKLCLSLGGVERPHFDRAAFRAGEKGNIFATLAPTRTEAMIKLDVDACEGLIQSQPERFFSLGGWSRMGATGVTLKAVTIDMLRPLLLEAWQLAEKPAKAKKARRSSNK